MSITGDLRQRADHHRRLLAGALAIDLDALAEAAQAVTVGLARPRGATIWTDEPDGTIPRYCHMGAEDGEVQR